MVEFSAPTGVQSEYIRMDAFKGARRQMQGGALAPLGFCFLVFAEHYPCTESDTETPSDSFLQSEIRQQVLVFHK